MSEKKIRVAVIPVIGVDIHRAEDCPYREKSGDGPSKVATEGYRDGWDRIFGGRQPRGEA